jgi:hypothetical protein
MNFSTLQMDNFFYNFQKMIIQHQYSLHFMSLLLQKKHPFLLQTNPQF